MKADSSVHVVRAGTLPFVGMSHQFIGEDHDTTVSIYLVEAAPGKVVSPHTHEYDEIMYIIEGTASATVDGTQVELRKGDLAVIKAGQVHGFSNRGEVLLRQLDVHLAPRFAQTQAEGAITHHESS